MFPNCTDLIKIISDSIGKKADALFQKDELSMPQRMILIVLNVMLTNRVSLKDLEKTLRLPQSTVFSSAQKLEEKALVEFVPDPLDKRVKHLVLSKKGLELCGIISSEMEKVEEKLLNDFTDEEKSTFLSLLMKATSNIMEE